MRRRGRGLGFCFVLLVALWVIGLWRPAAAQDPDVFELNLHFVFALSIDTANERARTEASMDRQIAFAETLFNQTPRLAISPTFEWRGDVDRVEDGVLNFESDRDYRTYMDRNFDVIATSRTTGRLQVLVVNKFCRGWIRGSDKQDDRDRICFGGSASFPHSVTPFKRKHGIIITRYQVAEVFWQNGNGTDDNDWILAHELGHFFGLLHSFDDYSVVKRSNDCNRHFSDEGGNDAGHCNSCTGQVADTPTGLECSGSFNVMDYCAAGSDITLNSCQQDRAVRVRERYMTNKGATDYFAMKGRQGEKACSGDDDCAGNEYCDRGTVTIGRNLCKPKKTAGTACTRKKQCVSNTCRLGKCR